MIDEQITAFTSGRVISHGEHNGLELNGQRLQCGDWLELRVFDAWIAGQVAKDPIGRYLLPPEGVGIRLRAGLTMRWCEQQQSWRTERLLHLV